MSKNSDVIDIYKSVVMPTYTPGVALMSGKGVTVSDVDGRKYYDFTSGIGIHTCGYGNPVIAEAIAKQASFLTHTSNIFVNVPQTALAKKLVG